MPQPSAMQIIACTRLPAFGGGQLCPAPRGLRGRVGTPVQPTPFIIFTVNGPLWLLFSVHPASLKLQVLMSRLFHSMVYHKLPIMTPQITQQLSSERGPHTCTHRTPPDLNGTTCSPACPLGMTLAAPRESQEVGPSGNRKTPKSNL